jgi:hypothetical protein
MESAPLLSSQDESGRVQLEGLGPTRNRKVEGSNPSSGSKTAGQRASLAMATALMGQAVIPWAGSSCRGLPSPLGCVRVLERWNARRSALHRRPFRREGRTADLPALRAGVHSRNPRNQLRNCDLYRFAAARLGHVQHGRLGAGG